MFATRKMLLAEAQEAQANQIKRKQITQRMAASRIEDAKRRDNGIPQQMHVRDTTPNLPAKDQDSDVPAAWSTPLVLAKQARPPENPFEEEKPRRLFTEADFTNINYVRSAMRQCAADAVDLAHQRVALGQRMRLLLEERRLEQDLMILSRRRAWNIRDNTTNPTNMDDDGGGDNETVIDTLIEETESDPDRDSNLESQSGRATPIPEHIAGSAGTIEDIQSTTLNASTPLNQASASTDTHIRRRILENGLSSDTTTFDRDITTFDSDSDLSRSGSATSSCPTTTTATTTTTTTTTTDYHHHQQVGMAMSLEEEYRFVVDEQMRIGNLLLVMDEEQKDRRNLLSFLLELEK